jgi:hypothetical protein
MHPKIMDEPDVLFEGLEASPRVWKPLHEGLRTAKFTHALGYEPGIRMNQKARIGSVSSEYGFERLEGAYTQKLKKRRIRNRIITYRDVKLCAG